MVHVSLPEAGRPFVLVEADGGEALDALDQAEVMDAYRNHGALLFRGFGPNLAQFKAFTGGFCSSSVFNESPDRLLLDDLNNIQSVNQGTEAFPLHPELSREPWKPDVAFFCCLTPPREDGQTTMCDGVAIVEALDPALRATLSGERLRYTQAASADQREFWLGTTEPSDAQLAHPPASCPYEWTRIDGQVVRTFSRPVLHKPMFDDRPAFGNFLLFAHDLLGRTGFPSLDDGRPFPAEWLDPIRQAAARLTVPVGWQAGDLLMLDNSRFMHGRTAITDPDRRMIATYFGYLKDAIPDAEELPDAPWRRTTFVPPAQGRIAA